MSQRVRNVVAGRTPYVDPGTLPNNDTVDFAPVFPGGIVVGNPALPEDVGTEAINAQPPAAPGTPTVTTGRATDHVYVNATWAAADAAEDVPPAAQYEVYVNVSGQNPTIIRTAATNLSIRIAPAKPSTTYQVKVRAISRLEVASAYSSYGSVTSDPFIVPVVTFAPTTPGAPTVTAAVYSLLVSWTALTDVTQGYGHYDVQIATDSGFTLNVRTRAIDGTITSFSDLTPGTTYYARVRGVAPDGTTGTFSTGSSSATTKIVAGDITANTITAAQIAADTITAAQIAADAITASELAAINLAVGKYIKSTSYSAGSAGWAIKADGTAEFQSITARGYILGSNIVQSEGGDLLNNGGGAPVNYHGDLSTQQIISNPGFEVNTTGWAARANCTVARITTQHHSGVACLEATGTNTSQAEVTSDTSSRFAVTTGHVYTATAWVRTAATTRTTAIHIAWYNAGGSVISTSDGTGSSDSTTWGIRVLSATAPALAVSAVVWVGFGTTTGAVSEKHQVDDIALWDLTAFTTLGWSFTSANPKLAYDPLGSLSILCQPSDISDLWYIEAPNFVPDSTKAYRASMQVVAGSNAVEPYTGEVQLVSTDGFLINLDGALANFRTSSLVSTTVDNFSTGGSGQVGIAAATALKARFGRPSAPIAILLAGDAYLRDFQLHTTGQVAGHLKPNGPVQGLQGGTFAMAGGAGSGTAATNTHVIQATGSPTLLSAIITGSDPGGYSDTTVNRRVLLEATCEVSNIGTTLTNSTLLLQYSLDGGTTFVTIHTQRTREGDAAGDGSGTRESVTCQGWFVVPAGIDPSIQLLLSHSSGTTASQTANGNLSWLIIPG